MDLNDLVIKAQEDNSALEFLLKSSKTLVLNLVNRYKTSEDQKDTLVQDGMMGLFQSIMSYRKNTDSNFLEYAEENIINKLISSIRSYGKENQCSVDFSAIQLDEVSQILDYSYALSKDQRDIVLKLIKS